MYTSSSIFIICIINIHINDTLLYTIHYHTYSYLLYYSLHILITHDYILYYTYTYIGGEVFTAFLLYGKKAVLNGLKHVGWETRTTDGHTDKLLRTTIIGLLDTFAWNDEEVYAEAKRRLVYV